jgi:hypothetical protein
LAIVVVVVLAMSSAYYISSSSGGNSTSIIKMQATDGTPQNGAPDQIQPTRITVTQGQHYIVVFENTDDGPHEEVIPALGFSTNIVQGGQTARVAFTPDKVGTFAFFQPEGACVSVENPAVSCTGAQDMNGTLTVLPP